MTRPPISHLVVAVPVCNEQRHLEGCLRSLRIAREQLLRVMPDLSVEIVAALDSCTDGSRAVAERFCATVISNAYRCVGATRDQAVTHGVLGALARGIAPERIWVCCTDADTLVPPHWLDGQVALANAGVDLLLGTVEPGHELSHHVRGLWEQQHELSEGHSYVHGANLGFRAATWSAVGGFGAMPAHEDRALVERAKRGGAIWMATDTVRVRTSARSHSRVPHGFAGYLAELAGLVPCPQPAGS